MYSIGILDVNHIPYLIKKGKFKRLTIRYSTKGVLLINQSYYQTDEFVVDFVEKHIDWILKHKPNKILPHDTYQNGDEYLLLGRTYFLEIINSKYEDAILLNNKIIVYVKDNLNVEKILNRFRYDQAELVFNEMFYKAFLVMKEHLNQYPKLIIKKSKTMWGCCYPKKNEVMLNLTLIHTPLPLIEYVIYHELSHFVYLNHSKEFHQFLQKYIKDENNRRKKLKNYCIEYK